MAISAQSFEVRLQRFFGWCISPSPRGRVWRGALAALLLGIIVGFYNYPAAWDRSMDFLNPKLAGIGLSRLSLPHFWNRPFRLGLDLAGGTHLVYEADMKQIPDSDRKDSLEGVRNVIERRVNAFGVAEPVVQTNRTANSWRLVVELAGIKDVNEAIRKIGETPVLEFREPNSEPSRPLTAEEERGMNEYNHAALAKAKEALKKVLVPKSDFASLAKEFSEDTGSARAGGDLGWIRRGQTVAPFEKAIFETLKAGEISRVLVDTQFGHHIIQKIEQRTVQEEGSSLDEVHVAHILIKVKRPADIVPPEPWKGTGLTGKQLKRAVLTFDQTTGAPLVSLQFNEEGAKLFEQITARLVNQPVAIFIDGAPIQIATVQQKITGGQAVITGISDANEARLRVRQLNAGALPVPINLIAQETVGAALGGESVNASLIAGLVGFALVALFMILYYRMPGAIAVLALCVYVGVVLALFKLIPVTLSLAGIAGFVLSIGMAVDANVLIFERLKEELKLGKPVGQALDEGFARAWTSIRDGNLTTLIAAAVLFWFSSSVIKGFALTLAVGVVVSMLSAITISRSFLRLVLPWFRSKWWYGV